MENYLVNYSDEALQDLRDIYDYISITLKESQTADAKIKRICNEIRTLNIFPRRYKAVEWEPWSKCEMRQMPVDNFIIFYVVDDASGCVSIVRILYGKRDLPVIIKNKS